MSSLRTVGAALRWASEQLTQAGVENPSVDAERLVQHVLGVKRVDLYLASDRLMTPAERASLWNALARRCRRIPLQYLTGETEFWSLPFFVSRAVLIPRHETEILVETAISKLRSIPRPGIVDIGTGSGCIAVSLAHELPEGLVIATDISPAAARVARTNALRNRVGDRVHLIVGDLADVLRPSAEFDAMVSNPPYVPRDQVESLQPEVRDHEPRLALDGGEDGLCLHRRLVACAGRHLRSGGWLFVEVGCGQIEPVKQMMRRSKVFEEVTHVNDLTGVGRVAVARRR